jgi:hypothetical protein
MSKSQEAWAICGLFYGLAIVDRLIYGENPLELLLVVIAVVFMMRAIILKSKKI